MRRTSGHLLKTIGQLLFGLTFLVAVLFVLKSVIGLAVGLGRGGRGVQGVGIYLFEEFFGFLVCPGLLALIAMVCYRCGKRIAAKRAHEKLEQDARPPILLLRSFTDDNIPLRYERWRDIFVPWAAARPRTFEELIVGGLSELGPVIAISRPGELLPPLGASRLWVDNDQWQGRVDELLGKSRFVVMILGEVRNEADGLGWEVQRLFTSCQPEKVVIVVPPIAEKEVAKRWAVYQRLSGERLTPLCGRVIRVHAGPLLGGADSRERLTPSGGKVWLVTFGPDWDCRIHYLPHDPDSASRKRFDYARELWRTLANINSKVDHSAHEQIPPLTAEHVDRAFEEFAVDPTFSPDPQR